MRGITSRRVILFDVHMKYGDVIPSGEVREYLSRVERGKVRTAPQGVAAPRRVA